MSNKIKKNSSYPNTYFSILQKTGTIGKQSERETKSLELGAVHK